MLPALAIPYTLKSVFAVIKNDSYRTVNYLAWSITDLDGLFTGGSLSGITGSGVVNNNSVEFTNTSESLNQQLHTWTFGTDAIVRTNGGDQVTDTATPVIKIGRIGRGATNLNARGVLQEFILYDVVKVGSEVTDIESNINGYYTIY